MHKADHAMHGHMKIDEQKAFDERRRCVLLLPKLETSMEHILSLVEAGAQKIL